jgi:hypothetical protein
VENINHVRIVHSSDCVFYQIVGLFVFEANTEPGVGGRADHPNKMKDKTRLKSVGIALSSREGFAMLRKDGGGDLTNIHHKAIRNCHNEFSLYNPYILIEMGKKIF